MIYWIIGIAGVMGSFFRYGLSLLVSGALGTLTANLLGCFLLSWSTVVSSRFIRIPSWAKVGIMTGLLGSFTTFSTFSVEVMRMIHERSFFMAIAYVCISSIGGLVFAYVGFRVGKQSYDKQRGNSE